MIHGTQSFLLKLDKLLMKGLTGTARHVKLGRRPASVTVLRWGHLTHRSTGLLNHRCWQTHLLLEAGERGTQSTRTKISCSLRSGMCMWFIPFVYRAHSIMLVEVDVRLCIYALYDEYLTAMAGFRRPEEEAGDGYKSYLCGYTPFVEEKTPAPVVVVGEWIGQKPRPGRSLCTSWITRSQGSRCWRDGKMTLGPPVKP